MIYYIVLFFLLSYSVIEVFTSERGKKRVVQTVLFVFISVFLVLFSGTRFEVGYDYYNYLGIYEDLVKQRLIFNFQVEPLFALWILIISGLFSSFPLFLFVIALVAVSFKLALIWNKSLLPFLSIALYFSRYFLIYDMGQIRQGLALLIVLKGIQFIQVRAVYYFVLCIFFAAMFHVSALIFLPAYYVVNKNFGHRYVLLALVLSAGIALIDLKIVALNIISFLPTFVYLKVDYYLSTETSVGITFAMGFRILLVLLFCVFRDKLRRRFPQTLIYFNIYIIGVILYLLFNSIPQFAGRLSVYYQIMEIFIIPVLIIVNRHLSVRAGLFVLVCIYCFWGVFSTIHSVNDAFIPYRSIFLKGGL